VAVRQPGTSTDRRVGAAGKLCQRRGWAHADRSFWTSWLPPDRPRWAGQGQRPG